MNRLRGIERASRTAVAVTVTAAMAAAVFAFGASPAVGSVGAAQTVVHRVANLPPQPDFLANGSCRGPNDDSVACNADIVKAIDHARTIETRSPMRFSMAGYRKLTLNEQIFAVANLERIARGLQPLAAITTQLDALAYAGAKAGRDPSLPTGTAIKGGARVVSWGGNWAVGFVNSLGSDYGWMYWDGPDSPNGDCTTTSPAGCYGHRHNILRNWSSLGTCPAGKASRILLGVGDRTQGASFGGHTYAPSLTELFVHACGPAPTDAVATWSHVKKVLGL